MKTATNTQLSYILVFYLLAIYLSLTLNFLFLPAFKLFGIKQIERKKTPFTDFNLCLKALSLPSLKKLV